jgi:hypothetical protein
VACEKLEGRATLPPNDTNVETHAERLPLMSVARTEIVCAPEAYAAVDAMVAS